jgi:DNA-binding transcriptional LysR family regulator
LKAKFEGMMCEFSRVKSHIQALQDIQADGDWPQYPFVLTEPSFGLRQQIDRILARHRIKPEIFFVTNSLALVKSVASVCRQVHASAAICGNGRNRRWLARHECGEGTRTIH